MSVPNAKNSDKKVEARFDDMCATMIQLNAAAELRFGFVNWGLFLRRWRFFTWVMIITLLSPKSVIFPERLASDSGQEFHELDEQKQVSDLIGIATRLRLAILARDMDTLLEYTPSRSEVGTYESATYDVQSEYRELLGDPKSWLYCQLFSTSCHLEYLRRYDREGTNPYRIAIRDFFESHKELRVKVRFLPYKAKGIGTTKGLRVAQILYIVPGSPEDKRFPPSSQNWRTRLKPWGKTYVDTCLVETQFGWRYYFAPIFICKE
jgi:hypothetical protein